MDGTMVETVAAEAFGLLGTGRQTASFSVSHPGLDLAAAYEVAAAVRGLREARGERVVGRKIGFTNRRIWDEYNVHAPIWGWMYEGTVREIAELGEGFALEGLAEPRIEPEVVFGLGRAPEPGMGAAALLDCVDWVAPGFEIVQSVFPGWVFTPADTVAAYGLHGALLLGPRRRLGADRAGWVEALAGFGVELLRDGRVVDRGVAANVLDGPLLALRHLNELLAGGGMGPGLGAGEMVTTGTLTRAFPVAPGQAWAARLEGVGLGGVEVRLR
jgi:2-oxo-3-hexenedioate decarboxylase